jgi:CRISPR system Cascade subunit CasC
MLLEAGDRQPRSLAEAFHTPVRPQAPEAEDALWAPLAALDAAYATGEERRYVGLSASPCMRGSTRIVLGRGRGTKAPRACGD